MQNGFCFKRFALNSGASTETITFRQNSPYGAIFFDLRYGNIYAVNYWSGSMMNMVTNDGSKLLTLTKNSSSTSFKLTNNTDASINLLMIYEPA